MTLLVNYSYLLVTHFFLWVPPFLLESYMEDRDLGKRFGKKFREYAERAPMFIPRVRLGRGKIQNTKV